MSSKQSALKGFQCLAVFDTPQSVTEEAPKKKKTAGTTSAPQPLVRYLYYKSHSGPVGDDDVRPGCTLFVVNIPFHYTAEHLTQLFACFGTVEQVSFLQASLVLQLDARRIGGVELNSFYRSAHVVFEEADSVAVAIKTDLSQSPQQCPEEEEEEDNVGVKKWLSHYHSSHPSVSQLQLQVDKFMEGFDARSAAEKAEARKGAQTDADGWTLVKGTSRGQKRQLLAVEEETARAQERAAKKLKANTAVHFYKHQEREQKKERLIQLREKFEQDKLKIAQMKQERKFKPY